MVVGEWEKKHLFSGREKIIEFFENIPIVMVTILLVFTILICLYAFFNLDLFKNEIELELVQQTIHSKELAVNRIFNLSEKVYNLPTLNQNSKKEVFIRLISDEDKKNLNIITYKIKFIFSSLKLPKKFLKDMIQIYNNTPSIVKYRYKNYLILAKFNSKQNLIILKGVDLDKIKRDVSAKSKLFMANLKWKLHLFLFVIILLFIVSILVIHFSTKKVHSIFKNYEEIIVIQKREAESGAKAKAEFLANMSHEIRTPLNAILGFIQILRNKQLDEESLHYLEIIEMSGNDLLTIINDILDFSKIEAGKLKIEEIEFNPKEQFIALKELFETRAKEKNIVLEMNENLEYNIISDPTRIKQVISNLLSNAIKFTPSNKKIVLNINFNKTTKHLYVEVIDEGIGIPKNKQQLIFQAFSQADSSTTRKYGGTGLGLAISYKLIKLLGGELRVESEENKGSRFYFKIAVKSSGKIDLNEDKNSKNRLLKERRFQYKLLLVEDNRANQMFMKIILNEMGLNFDIANNGVEAFEMFKNSNYDIILMDENMPKMNGIEATKKIREYETKNNLKKVTIVALTANAIEGDKEKFIKAGMDFYLSKPLDIKKLESIFRNIET